MASCKIFQVYYDQKQILSLYNHKFIEPVFNPIPKSFNFNDGYFLLENKIILDKLTNDLNFDYIGVWSHKHFEKMWHCSEDGMYNKTHGPDKFMIWLQNKMKSETFDVIGFHRRMNKYHKVHMITAAERFHPNFKMAIDYIVRKARLPVNLRPPFSYITLMNYQIAKKDVYLRYVNTVLKPAIDLMMDKKETQLQSWLFSDSKYGGDAVNEGTLQRISGTNYYTMHSFILERLFTLFLNANKRLKCISY